MKKRKGVEKILRNLLLISLVYCMKQAVESPPLVAFSSDDHSRIHKYNSSFMKLNSSKIWGIFTAFIIVFLSNECLVSPRAWQLPLWRLINFILISSMINFIKQVFLLGSSDKPKFGEMTYNMNIHISLQVFYLSASWGVGLRISASFQQKKAIYIYSG